MAWIAWSLLALWAAVALASGLYDFFDALFQAQAVHSVSGLDNPLPGGLGLALWLLWLLITFNLAPVGLIVGVIAVARDRASLALRVIALLVLVVGMTITEFAVPALSADSAVPGRDFVHDGRLSGLLIVLVALVFAAASYWVLPHAQRRTRPRTSLP